MVFADCTALCAMVAVSVIAPELIYKWYRVTKLAMWPPHTASYAASSHSYSSYAAPLHSNLAILPLPIIASYAAPPYSYLCGPHQPQQFMQPSIYPCHNAI